MTRRLLGHALLAALFVGHAGPILSQQRSAPPARFTLDTPIERLLRDRRAKTVLTGHLPALVGDSHLWMYDHKSLNEVAAYQGSSLSRDKLRTIASELAKIR